MFLKSEIDHIITQSLLGSSEYNFILYGQEINAIETPKVKSNNYELLLRLRVNNNILNAGDFLPYVLDRGVQIGIDEWVTTETNRLLLKNPEHKYCINYFPETLRKKDFHKYIETHFADNLKKRITIEVSEKVDLDDQLVGILVLTHDICDVVLDDFVLEDQKFPRSLTLLKNDFLTGVKVDHSIIQNLDDSRYMAYLIAIMAVCQSRGLYVVAECVSNRSKLEQIRKIKNEFTPNLDMRIQGYAVSYPTLLD